MSRNQYEKVKIITNKYGKGNDFNDHVEGFIDEEGPDIRENDDDNHEYTMRLFPNPDW